MWWGDLVILNGNKRRVGDELMKKIFSYNVDTNKTAYMNWRTRQHEPIQSMNVIAYGYFQSAILLAEECIKDNYDKKADVLIFPMLFSVNHAIELYEKSICWSLNILLGQQSTFKKITISVAYGMTRKRKYKNSVLDMDMRKWNLIKG